jgi:hypothetical protein
VIVEFAQALLLGVQLALNLLLADGLQVVGAEIR